MENIMLSEMTKTRLLATVEVMKRYYTRVDMSDWCTDDKFEKLTREKSCGTVGCLAGYAINLYGEKVFPEGYSTYARSLLELNWDQGVKLFYTCDWPETFRQRLDKYNSGTKKYVLTIEARVKHFIKTDGRE
jgi:hypothetical protein